jgi:DNA-binding PadR family transcriptional regulator
MTADKISRQPTPTLPDNAELSRFQEETLFTIAEHGPMIGLDVKHYLGERYDEGVNHGRLYPNLDELVEGGLVEKGEVNGRTNRYELTERGAELLHDLFELRARQLGLTEDE